MWQDLEDQTKKKLESKSKGKFNSKASNLRELQDISQRVLPRRISKSELSTTNFHTWKSRCRSLVQDVGRGTSESLRQAAQEETRINIEATEPANGKGQAHVELFSPAAKKNFFDDGEDLD